MLTENQIIMTKDALKNSMVTVEFEKTDGTTRIMKCTCCDTLIPEKNKPKGDSPRNENVQRCFDVEKQEWRSFKWEKVYAVVYGQ